jgi:hypothetical protein
MAGARLGLIIQFNEFPKVLSARTAGELNSSVLVNKMTLNVFCHVSQVNLTGVSVSIKLATMTRAQITVAGFVATLAAAAFIQFNIQAGQETTALHPPAPPGEAANITYSISSMPAYQVFSLYAALANEKLIAPASIDFRGGVRVKTTRPITRTEALKLLETALAEQAQITITRSTNGSLVGIPNEKTQVSPAGTNAVRTYLPDGTIDPPLPPSNVKLEHFLFR